MLQYRVICFLSGVSLLPKSDTNASTFLPSVAGRESSRFEQNGN